MSERHDRTSTSRLLKEIVAARSGVAEDGGQVRRREPGAAVEDQPRRLCDALDHAACDATIPNFKERRDEEDALSATLYSTCPTPRTSWSRWRIRCWRAASSTRPNCGSGSRVSAKG